MSLTNATTTTSILENDAMIHVVLKTESCTKPSVFHDKSEPALTVVLAREFVKQVDNNADLSTIASYLPFSFTGMKSASFEAMIPGTLATFILSKPTIKFIAQDAEYVLTTAEGTGMSKGVTKKRAELTVRISFEAMDPFSHPTAAKTIEATEWICNVLMHAGLKPLDTRRGKNEFGAPIRIYYADFEVPDHFYPGRLHQFAFGTTKTTTGHNVEFHFPKEWAAKSFNICAQYRCLERRPCACDRRASGPSHNGGHAKSAKRAKLATLWLTEGSMD